MRTGSVPGNRKLGVARARFFACLPGFGGVGRMECSPAPSSSPKPATGIRDLHTRMLVMLALYSFKPWLAGGYPGVSGLRCGGYVRLPENEFTQIQRRPRPTRPIRALPKPWILDWSSGTPVRAMSRTMTLLLPRCSFLNYFVYSTVEVTMPNLPPEVEAVFKKLSDMLYSDDKQNETLPRAVPI